MKALNIRSRYLLLVLSLAVFFVFPGETVNAASGDEKYKKFVADTPIVKDPKLRDYVNRLGQKLAAKSNNPDIKFTFTVLDSPGLNAFAHEGGYVYIYRGLMGYMRNEAQLAAVLAHEIGHVTERHVSRQKSGNISGKVLAALAGMLSGSQDVFEAGQLLSSSLIRGYGRNMELEADLTGAQTMARLGYDPQHMIDMLSIMKDYEALTKKKAAAKGGGNQTYHGLFSTHPRNDARLRTVVTEANKLAKSAAVSLGSGANTYRLNTEGLIWGENFAAKEKKPYRYNNMIQKIRFDFPESWQWQELLSVVKGRDKDKKASLSLESLPRTAQSPEEFIHNQLKMTDLEAGKNISPVGLKGYSAVVPGVDTASPRRLAVIYYKLKAYVITGEVADAGEFDQYDKIFEDSISTFRTITQREIDGQKPKSIHYVKAVKQTDFAALAKKFDLGRYGEEELRLMNGYYPTGQPSEGQWIKIIR
ncbi:MAG: putative Zn-dependent protease [Oceanicoccus sp.]|jgi:predicted Zn-dependent protease